MKKLTCLLVTVLALTVAACSAPNSDPVPQAALRETAPLPTPTLIQTPAPLPPPVLVIPEAAIETAAPETEVVTGGPISAWPETAFGYGVQSHATIGDPKFTMDVIRNQLGMDWVKVQLEWPLVNPEPDVYQWFFYDGAVTEANDHNLRLMLSVVGAPFWTRASNDEHGPPDDYNDYVSFLNELLQRYPGQIHAIEVWNEQNLDREWKTAAGIVPEDYVRLLSLAYQAIKAFDPNIIVISGAPSPTGDGDWVRWANDFDYLDQALAAGMLDYADCVGAHHNGYNLPPDVRVEDANNHPKASTALFRGPFDNQYTGNRLNHLWTFKSTLDGYVERVRRYDPNIKLCVTEFGWASSEGYDVIPQGFEFAQDNSLEEQAEYLVQAFQLMRNSGDFWLAFLFNYDFGNKGNGPADDTVPYSIIDINGIARPAFHAVSQMEKNR
jgi:polysaccharide biosynthesis protein PslG